MKYKARSVEATSPEPRDGSVKTQNLIITKSLQGRKLKKPLVLKVLEPQCPADLKLQNFVIETFISRIHALAQFTFDNSSTMKIARYLLFNRTASRDCLFNYIYSVYRFCKWVNIQPDQLVKKCVDKNGVPKPKALVQTRCLIEDFVAHLQTENLSSSYIIILVKGVLALLRLHGLKLLPPFRLANYNICCDRAPSREELRKILDVADLRERVIITMLASGGFRTGTLAKLQYRHVKRDLARRVFPIHVHVEAEITKSKHHDYDTFLCQEASEYLEAYMEARRKGWKRRPPEQITNQSPLISAVNKKPKPLTPSYISDLIHWLYVRAGLLKSSSSNRRYILRTHSLRKFFRTQLAFLGVDRDYIEYMMGHKISSYFDIKMRGIEHLRAIYLSSGMSIKPQSEENKINALKQIIKSWRLDPEKILAREALGQSRITGSAVQTENGKMSKYFFRFPFPKL